MMNMKGIELIMHPTLTQGKIITKTTRILGFVFKEQLISQRSSNGTDESVSVQWLWLIYTRIGEQGPRLNKQGKVELCRYGSGISGFSFAHKRLP